MKPEWISALVGLLIVTACFSLAFLDGARRAAGPDWPNVESVADR